MTLRTSYRYIESIYVVKRKTNLPKVVFVPVYEYKLPITVLQTYLFDTVRDNRITNFIVQVLYDKYTLLLYKHHPLLD